jgi:hypothetical protein
MSQGRIFFPGNPWPEGHPVEIFQWTASSWHGRIALSFGGDPDYDRAFTATLFGVQAPTPG